MVEVLRCLELRRPSPHPEKGGIIGSVDLALKEKKSPRVLYLAIPLETYRVFFSRQFIQTAIEYNKIKLLVYDPDKEVIVEWKN